MKKPYKYNFRKNGGHPSGHRAHKRLLKTIAREKHEQIRAELAVLDKKTEIVNEQYVRFLGRKSWVGFAIFIGGWLLIAFIARQVPAEYTYKTVALLWMLLLGCLFCRSLYSSFVSTRQSKWYRDQRDALHEAKMRLYNNYC